MNNHINGSHNTNFNPYPYNISEPKEINENQSSDYQNHEKTKEDQLLASEAKTLETFSEFQSVSHEDEDIEWGELDDLENEGENENEVGENEITTGEQEEAKSTEKVDDGKIEENKGKTETATGKTEIAAGEVEAQEHIDTINTHKSEIQNIFIDMGKKKVSLETILAKHPSCGDISKLSAKQVESLLNKIMQGKTLYKQENGKFIPLTAEETERIKGVFLKYARAVHGLSVINAKSQTETKDKIVTMDKNNYGLSSYLTVQYSLIRTNAKDITGADIQVNKTLPMPIQKHLMAVLKSMASFRLAMRSLEKKKQEEQDKQRGIRREDNEHQNLRREERLTDLSHRQQSLDDIKHEVTDKFFKYFIANPPEITNNKTTVVTGVGKGVSIQSISFDMKSRVIKNRTQAA